MIYIAICDDEKYMSDKIRNQVSAFFRKKNMEASILQFPSGGKLLKYRGAIDILFLDIQMEGLNGMETAKRLRSCGFKGFLIFITVLKEMVFQSFEVRAYDYLIKPVMEEQFERTMERLYLSMKSEGETGLLIQKGNESRIIPFDGIVYCEVIDRKVYLHLKSEEVVDYYDRIEKLEERLDRSFFRCHRSYLIHLKYLKSYKDGTAWMEGGKEVPVSRGRRKEFSGIILQYMKDWRS
ncbi:DNA-binding response regulator [bacterium C-53]|nr:DNA-binding response regulator [Lachnospiraceae bacterium]NBI03380.1 DNA-binding response regulator [Lachnospiraceae bacterium]RKJ09913.1 DNA-binding response regulator [bacterium C-53]